MGISAGPLAFYFNSVRDQKLKKILYSGLIFFCLMLLQCSDGSDHKPDAKPEAVKTKSSSRSKTLSKDMAEIKSACDCSEYAIATLDNALALRSEYQDVNEYEKDSAAVKKMDEILVKWHALQKHCLLNYGTQLFVETECNQPQVIADKRKALKALGIKT